MFDQTPEQGRPGRAPSINVLGGALQPCSLDPVTGFYCDGCCNTGSEDVSLHTVCVVLTAEFLGFPEAPGKLLLPANAEIRFPRPKAGRSLVPVRQPLEGGAGCRRSRIAA